MQRERIHELRTAPVPHDDGSQVMVPPNGKGDRSRTWPHQLGGARFWLFALAWIGLAGATSLTLLWCVASFWFPYGWDQAILASIGEVILRGGMPYRDGWDMKGPLAYYVFALGQWLFGPHMWSVRILDLPVLLGGMTALALMVGRLTVTPLGACWTAVAFALWIGSLGWFHTIQPDAWVAIFMLLGVGPLVVRRPALPQLLFCGIMVGCAALVKPLYLGFVAVPLVHIVGQKQSPMGSRLALAAAVAGIALVPPLLALAWFAHRGALRDLVDVHLLYTVQVYTSVSLWSRIRNVLDGVLGFFLTGTVSLALPIIVIGVHALWRGSRACALLLLTWFIIALMCVVAQGKFFKYHWIRSSRRFSPLVQLASIRCL